MRRDELLRPDVVSETLLVLAGTVLALALGSTAWLAILHH